MEFLSKKEAKALLFRRTSAREKGHRTFPIPTDAGRRVALVADLMRRFEGGRIVVVFCEWGVWPSGERMHVFDRFRASYGETRRLIDTPVHAFKKNEFEDAVSFVTLGVLFLWDIDVFGEEAIFLSHDEIGHASFNVGRWSASS